MTSVLDDIVDGVREDVAGSRGSLPLAEVKARRGSAPPALDAIAALRHRASA